MILIKFFFKILIFLQNKIEFARQRRQLERAAEETSRPIFTDASAQNLYQEKRKLEKKVLAVQSERDEARRRASMFEDRTAISEMAYAFMNLIVFVFFPNFRT